MIENWLENIKNKENPYIHFDIRPNIESGIINIGGKLQCPQSFFEDFLLPLNVAKRGFWPLIHFTKKENRFKMRLDFQDGEDFFEIKPKEREIYYASHFDSYILSYYSQLLGFKYDSLLKEKGLSEKVLAYRHIPVGDTKGGKNNIYFSKDVFEEVITQKNCIVFAFDITGFFDNLNHLYLKEKLTSLIGTEILPNDHFNIFKFVTNYDYIEKKDIDKNRLIIRIGEEKVINTEKFRKIRAQYKKDKKENFIKKNNKKGIDL